MGVLLCVSPLHGPADGASAIWSVVAAVAPVEEPRESQTNHRPAMRVPTQKGRRSLPLSLTRNFREGGGVGSRKIEMGAEHSWCKISIGEGGVGGPYRKNQCVQKAQR